MKLLEEVVGFPSVARNRLGQAYGIDSAEAFYVNAVKNGDGMRTALQVSPEELERLVRLVEAFLSPDYIRQCKQPVAKHARGVILD